MTLSRRGMLLGTVAVFTGGLGRDYADIIPAVDIVVVDGWVLARADLMPGIESRISLAPLFAK